MVPQHQRGAFVLIVLVVCCKEENPSVHASLCIAHSQRVFLRVRKLGQASPEGAQERMLDFQPDVIYLKFESVKWRIHKELERGVYPMVASCKTWIVSEGTKICAKRRGFRIVPDFSETAHSVQGASLVAAVVDCLTVDHCSKTTDMLAGYIGLSRVKTKEALLIAGPFSPALFCHGQPPGPEILMKVLRQEITADDAKKDSRCSVLLSLSLSLSVSPSLSFRFDSLAGYHCSALSY